jgi:hypothetical protein
MPQVTVNHNGHSIRISSKDLMEAGSVDLTDGNWPELAWNPDEVTAALRALDAQPHNPRRVNCQQGQNRSPTMAVLYLWWKGGGTLGAAYDAVVLAYGVLAAPLGTAKMQNLLGQLLGGYTGIRRWAWNDIRALQPGAAAPLWP